MSGRTLSPGARIGGYLVEQMIGAGGMGQVYAATHEFLGVRVALKVLHQEFRGRAELVEKMRAEAQLLRKLEHPNLVRVSDAGMTTDGTVWMAMDLLTGESLRGALDRQRLPVGVVVQYIGQAAAGLCAAHAQGVIHRDIKPENIFITESGDVKLLDFGTAKFRELGMTATDAERFATMAYASPEQLSGKGDGRIDVYALGLIMHEALTGAHYMRRPDGTFPTVGQMMMLQLSTEVPTDGQPAPVAEVLRRATAKRAEDRYASMQELARALEDLSRQYPGPRPVTAVTGDATALTLASAERAPSGLRVSSTVGLALLVAVASSGATLLAETRLGSEPTVARSTQPPPEPSIGAPLVEARDQRSGVRDHGSAPQPSTTERPPASSAPPAPTMVAPRPVPRLPTPLPVPPPPPPPAPPPPFKRF